MEWEVESRTRDARLGVPGSRRDVRKVTRSERRNVAKVTPETHPVEVVPKVVTRHSLERSYPTH